MQGMVPGQLSLMRGTLPGWPSGSLIEGVAIKADALLAAGTAVDDYDGLRARLHRMVLDLGIQLHQWNALQVWWGCCCEVHYESS